MSNIPEYALTLSNQWAASQDFLQLKHVRMVQRTLLTTYIRMYNIMSYHDATTYHVSFQ